MSGLYAPDGTFMPFKKEELSTELANRENAFLYTHSWYGLLPDPDPILRKMGEDAQILQDLCADEQVTTAMQARKNRVLNQQDYAFSLGSLDGKEANEQEKLVFARFTKDLERLKMRSLLSSILDAPFFGMVPLEILWEMNGSWWHIKDIIARPYSWFGYDEKNNPLFKGEQYLYDNTPLPAGKFVIATHDASYDNPYGLRLLSRCLWPVTFKRGGLQFYARFIEKYGIPWVIGEAPTGALKHEKQEIAQNLARMVNDAIAVIPKGASVQIISPSGQETSMHEAFLARQDKAISKIIMGQTLTLEMEGKNNSQAAATTHQDVANDIAEADKSLICETMNEIAWLYTMLNVGEAYLAPIFQYKEPEDLLTQASLDKGLYELGVRFEKRHFEEKYNLKAESFRLVQEVEEIGEVQENTVSSFATKKTTKKKEVGNSYETEIAHQEAFDDALIALLPDVISSNTAFLDGLLEEVEKASSAEDLENILIERLGADMGMSELEDILATSLLQAESFGMFSSQEEMKELEVQELEAQELEAQESKAQKNQAKKNEPSHE